MLQINENVPEQSYEEAFRNLTQAFKNQSPVQAQNDYQQLLTSIFSATSRRDSEYVKAARETAEKPEIPDSAIDKIIKVWDEVFPQRKVILENNKVKAKDPSNNPPEH